MSVYRGIATLAAPAALPARLLSVCVFFLTVPFALLAAEPACDSPLARAASVEGRLEVRQARKTGWRRVQRDDEFCPGDTLRTGGDSRAAILFYPESVIRLDAYSSLVFTEAETAETAPLLELLEGIIHFISRDPRALQITTPLANAAIRGTEFLVSADQKETGVIVYEGGVEVSNREGSVELGPNEGAVARAGAAPVARALVRPRDAVQWTLYYPPVLDGKEGGDARLQQAAEALSVGAVDRARGLLAGVLEKDARNAEALALQSIIALTQNEKESARELAQSAVASGSGSAAARIAMSYVQQAEFDLAGALTSLQNAVGDNPGHALAWARLAELQLSQSELKAGLESAERAGEIAPGLALTHTVRGFAYLTEIDVPKALSAFETAIALDQAAPLPRLGLGLAQIRKGRLAAGRESIEIAVSLDPGNSLIRSYMGKAYYEEKRDRLAGKQYEMAKALDPKDPTPWFYDAIRKQTENRPIEALHDMQTSIALNDNRAVFRSRLQLDQDLATRSASQARIYNDLGFEQLALRKGWEAVNADPSNYSAHRLLADSYSSLPRHEIARVSELLQSQLLQPINMTPVPPQLAETNLFILDGAGPSDAAYLEFHPLFTRNRLALQADGLIGSNSTWGEDLIHSGVYDNWSWSIGQFHYESNGYRDNNDQDQNIYDLFVQNAISPSTSVQAEYRSRRIKNGDLVQRFEPDDFLPTQREKTTSETWRLGLHHVFSPRSEIIASFIKLDDLDYGLDESIFQEFPPFPGLPPLTLSQDLNVKQNEQASVTEIQHLYRGPALRLTSGARYFSGRGDQVATVDTTFLPPVLPGSRSEIGRDFDHEHKAVYSYANIPWGKKILVTAGASYVDVDQDQTTRSTIGGVLLPARQSNLGVERINPKMGLTWRVVDTTTVRAAAFRTVTQSWSNGQTIEPTQLAGFNQLFDDPLGTKATVYGLAADRVFSSYLSGGVEYRWRQLDVPFLLADGEFGDVGWDEEFGHAYVHWTPTQRVAASLEYLYELFERDSEFTGEFQATRVRTQRVPLTLSYFHPNGFSARLRATYIEQRGEFATNAGGFRSDFPTEHKKDDFWLLDAALGYRLPKRRGLISVGVSNLFDQSFKFVDTDPFHPRVYPERYFFSRVSLSF